jgi:MGT family glycosyltransferase
VAEIAVVHVPFFSHIGAATRLTAVLTRQGHSVTAWGPEPCRSEIEDAGARFVLHRPQMPQADTFVGFVAALAACIEAYAEEMIEQLFDSDPDLLIHDSQVPWARVAGDYLGLPRICTHPMFPLSDSHRIRTAEEQMAPRPDPDEATRLFEASWMSIARRWGVELGRWETVIHSSFCDGATTFAFTTEEILGEYIDRLPDGWNCIGPLMGRPIPPAPPGERPLVYVCFGTSFNRRVHQFTSAIEGLADEPVDVVISTGKGMITPAELEPLPANVTVQEFAPGVEMLSRASVHITHGGNNSVHESLIAGVPMLCIPQAYDQFPLTSRVEQLGAGRVVHESPSAIRDGVRWLLEDDSARTRARELGENLLCYDSDARIAEVVERMLDDDLVLAA